MHCAVVHFAVMHCADMQFAIMHCVSCTVLSGTHGGAMHCAVNYCAVMHCAVVHCVVIHCAVMHCAVLHCAVIHCAVMHCAVMQGVHYGMFPGDPEPGHPSTVWNIIRPHNWRPTTEQEYLVKFDSLTGGQQPTLRSTACHCNKDCNSAP